MSIHNEVRLEYKVLNKKKIEYNKKDAKLYGNMFSRLNKLEAFERKGLSTKGNHQTKQNEGESLSEGFVYAIL